MTNGWKRATAIAAIFGLLGGAAGFLISKATAAGQLVEKVDQQGAIIAWTEGQVKLNTPRLSALEAWKEVHVQTQEIQTKDLKDWMARMERKLDDVLKKK
jgi:hypothetical protein